MHYFKQSITLTLLAALSMGSMHAMEPPKQKQRLLQRLVMLYKANRDLMRQNIHLNLPKEKLKQLRAERRRILKRVALAGLTAAFLAAIGVAVGVAAKKRGEREKAQADQNPTFEELHARVRPPAPAPASEPITEEQAALAALRAQPAVIPKGMETLRGEAPGVPFGEKLYEDPKIKGLLGETD